MKSGYLVLAAGLALAASLALAEDSAPDVQLGAEVVGEELIPDLGEVAARDLPVVRPWKPGDPIKDIPRRRHPRDGSFVPEEPTGEDPLLEVQAAFAEAPASVDPLLNFNGQGYTGVNPPDTVGDVGGAYYVQSINGSGGSVVTIYNKTTGAVAAGPFAMDGLAATGSCASGAGDPIVLYDRAADRWMLSEFASGGNHLCVYISTTNNPAGTYCRYDFTTPSFPDYPKYGVWPDAYYVTTNESSPSIYALDRANMATCGTARAAQRFTVPDLSGFGFQTLTPADLDGVTDPPAGAPGIVMRHRDTEAHGPAGLPANDQLELWEFHVDWTTPANSTLAALPILSVAEFDSTLCGLTSFSCMSMPNVAQGSGSSLDPLREVVMNRLAYRVLGGQEVLVGNLVTDVGADRGGVRWFELRNSGGGWSLAQEGTYAPADSVNRWMAGIAMDGAGNILLGYNASGSAVSPSLRYTGRYSTDPAGTMTVAETVLVAGSATNGSNRYGDYSAMSVDPTDDCTFWFTGEYNAASTWSTRIGSVKFSACGTPDFNLGVTPPTLNVCAPANAVYTVNVGQVSGFTDPVTLATTGTPAGATIAFGTNPVTPPGSSSLTLGTGAVDAGNYNFNVTGSSTTPLQTINVGLNVATASPGAATLLTPANAALNVPALPVFTWGAVSGANTYTIQVATDAGFTNVVASATGLAAATWTSNVALNTSTQHFWRVRATNACGDSLYSSVFSFTTVAAPGDCGPGTTANIVYQYGFEAGVGGWTHSGTGDSWAISTTNPHSGTSLFHANDPAVVSDQRLVSPAVVLPTGQNPLVLKFWHLPNLENNGTTACYDGGILEVSTDGGTSWTQVPNANLLVGPYTGLVSASFSNPLAGLQAWCNGTVYIQTIADVSAYAGQTAQFRLRLGSDTSMSDAGWDVDDVVVQSCVSSTIFIDGFESGNTSLWSATVP